MLPKVEEDNSIDELPDVDVIALLETPDAIKNIEQIASNTKVKGLALGGADLSASLGSTMDWDSLCLLYTSPSPRDRTRSRMPSSA